MRIVKIVSIFTIIATLFMGMTSNAVISPVSTEATEAAEVTEMPGPPVIGLNKSTASFDRKSYGIVDVLFNTGSQKKIKLILTNNGQRYIYNLHSEERYISFPLQMGDGAYALSIYENTSGTKYRKLYSSTGAVALEDQKIVFLNSIQQVEWQNDDVTIAFANKLLEDYKLETYGVKDINGVLTIPEDVTVTDQEIIDLYYNWVVHNVVYDYEKIKTLNYDYVPDIDMIFEVKTGICYDYSVLFSSMLRSQDIPSRLIKGYTSWTKVYHAWNEVYIADRDEWVVVDTTYDSYLYLRNRSYEFEKSKDVYTTSYFF